MGKIFLKEILQNPINDIQLLKDRMEINYPFHEVAKILFDEGPHSIS